jgi:NitT/TauT family transport system substrate-binding protein
MSDRQAGSWSRREFVGRLTLAGTAGLLEMASRPAAAEPPPETMRLRVVYGAAVCDPLLVAEELLRSEGFTDVQYVMKGGGNPFYRAVASGEGDMLVAFAAALIPRMDLADPLLFLAGLHLGCLELFATKRIRSITDLKGKTVAVVELGSPQYVLLAPMLTYVGIDPRRDINWVIHPYAEQGRLLAEGKIDAFVAFPPFAQELRAKNIGHVILNTAMDRPWSQYFCCMVVGNRAFVQKHPRATKRALRAILKATDICASEPERVARLIMDRAKASDRWKPPPNYDYTLQTNKELPYRDWRQYDPDDTVRFFALRLREAGMIKSTPQKIISQATDWRFVNELKKELKG